MFDLDDVTRHIMGFSKIPDRHGAYLAEVDYEFAVPIPLVRLQKIFNVDPNEPDEILRYLMSSYNLDKEKAEELQPFIKEKLDLNKYYFQLECSDKKSYKEWKEKFGQEEKLEYKDLIYFVEAYPNYPDENGEMWSKCFELQKPITLGVINKIFNIDPNDKEIFRGDEIDAEQAKALQPYFKEKLDIDRYLIYFTSKLKL